MFIKSKSKFNSMVKPHNRNHSSFIDIFCGYQNSIFLAGVSRSGTTWLSDIINYNNEYRYIFEPFRPTRVKACQSLKDRQYITPLSEDKQLLKITKNVLSGRVKSEWSDRLNKRFISNKRLIKDVSSNLFLKWLHNNFPKLPIVLLLRHPCAVANSKLKLQWGSILNSFLVQEDLIEDYLLDYKNYIKDFQKSAEAGEDLFKNHFLSWCIENYVPLKQFNQGEIHIIFYEDLCTNPIVEINRLFSYLNKDYDQEKILQSFNKPSKLSRKHSAILTGDNRITSWQRSLTSEQIKIAVDILSVFGLDQLYSADVMPHSENLSRFMNAK